MGWISVKDKLPDEHEYVRVIMVILFKSEKDALYIKNYFVSQGENITKWVTHWRPLPEPSED